MTDDARADEVEAGEPDEAGLAGPGEEAAIGIAPVKEPVDVRKYLPVAGLVIAAWASLPQFSGPALNTEASKEIADHTIPAILMALACLYALVSKPKGAGPGMVRFAVGAVVFFAGLWMMATHIPLIAQAFNGDAPWPATLYHSSPAFAVFGLGLLWVVFHWSDLAAMEAIEREQQQAASAPGDAAG